MKKTKLKKLTLSKRTVSELGAEAIVVGISGNACNPGGVGKESFGCPPYTLPVVCHGSAGCFRHG